MTRRYVTREEWNARPARGRPPTTPEQMDGIILHHSAGPTTQTPRQVQDFHLDTRGWLDVAYHWMGNQLGEVFEGRDIYARSGAHTPVNHLYYGYCFLGNYEHDELAQAQIDQFKLLRADMMALGVGNRVRVHSEFSATACPGRNTRNALTTLAAELDGWAGISQGSIPP